MYRNLFRRAILPLQKVYARLEERDWLLINEDKRPSVITSGMDGSRSSVVADSTSGEREFQGFNLIDI